MAKETIKTLLVGFLGLAVLLYALSSLYKIITTTAQDFSVFYQSAGNLLSGRNLYTDSTLYTGLGYPPVTMLLFLPLRLLPYQWAQAVWVLGSFVAFLLCVYIALRLNKSYTVNKFVIGVSLGFLAFPTKFTLGMGQSNFFGLLALLSSIYWCQKGRFGLGAVSLVVMLLVKPHLILFLPWFWIARQARMVLVSIIYYGGGLFLTGVFFGWQNYFSYIWETIPGLMVFRDRSIYYNQGLGAFFSRLLPNTQASMVTLILSLILVAWSYYFTTKKKLPLFDSVVLFAPVYLLVEPLSWQHHFIFLIPLFLLLYKKFERHWTLLGTLAVSYLLIGVNIKQPALFSGTLLLGTVLSHVFWGTAILTVLGYYAYTHRSIFR